MAALKRLVSFLDKNKAKYKIVKHRKVYTAYDAALTQRLSLKMVGKVVLVKADNDFVLAVIPANKKLDFKKMKSVLNKYLDKNNQKKVRKLSICTEKQIVGNLTKKTEALSSFGSLYKKLVLVDKSLLRQKKINLNAGSFTESLEMTAAQYKKIEKPIEGSFSK